jgi:hypothetical protein
MEEKEGPAVKRAKEGAGETERPIAYTPAGASSHMHGISLNIAGMTLGHSQANDGEIVKLLRNVHGEITKVREGMDINRDEITKLNRQLELQNSKLDLQTKMQNLAFAFQNAEATSFTYYPENHPTTSEPGDNQGGQLKLVRPILLSFRRGSYYSILSKHGTLGPTFYDLTGNERRKSEQAFRDKLSEQIHGLTGVKPRFEFKKEEDSYWIYYS